jgi:N-dimethylarginine dimethylaminohydrolase
VTLLFWGGRTDRTGLEAARAHFDGEILELRIEEPAFHGNMALLPVDEAGFLLVCGDLLHEDSMAALEARFGRDAMHLVSQEEIQCYATNALPIGATLLAPSIFPGRVRRVVEREGMSVAELGMPELCEKAGGGTRCLVCKIENAPESLSIPSGARLSDWASALRR